MTLDVVKFGLRYCVNNIDYGAAYQVKEQTEYRAVVDILNAYDSIKFISYNQFK